ncbi:MAG: T9SS type A sorting domain-containing protein, partial [Ignavibacteriaceae bacterium]|nr:T9SS type A sorting domain-containing protein [Ignavibacteriaceae bacterium]
MLNDTLGWVCGLRGTLLKTTDAGVNWQSVDIGYPNISYWAIDFLDENLGVITLGNGSILKTTDGGESWTDIQTGTTNALYCVDIIDPLHIIAAGEWYQVAYTSDGGNTWHLNDELPYDANAIQFTDTSTGYAVGGENLGIWKTTNGGMNWFHAGEGGEWGVSLLSDGTGYAVGMNLKIYKRTGGLDNWYKLILNESWSNVFFINENVGYLTCADLGEKVYKTEDGGNSYSKIENSPEYNSVILFIDSLTGFLGSDKIYKTTDGGVNWYAANGTGGVSRIFFVNEQDGWAVGGNKIYKTTDGGENWSVNFNLQTFTNIYFVDSVYGWTSGSIPCKTTDGGEIWTQQTNASSIGSDDVYFLNPDTGWVTKYSSIFNSLFKTVDGGLNWIAVPEVVGSRKFFHFPDPVHWIIIGFSRYYITNNYGNSWVEFTETVPTGLVSFNAPTNDKGFFVGTQGLILRYEDTTNVPVELLSFTGDFVDKSVSLKWKTATEVNNRGFIIEKSFNKKDWDELTFINGKGTSTEKNEYSFIDHSLIRAVQYYRLKQIDFDGTFNYSRIIEVRENLPLEFKLYQNYPNPFNPKTNIEYNLTKRSHVCLSIFNIIGQRKAIIVDEIQRPGKHLIEFNAMGLTSGIYFYELKTDEHIFIKKMIVLK